MPPPASTALDPGAAAPPAAPSVRWVGLGRWVGRPAPRAAVPRPGLTCSSLRSAGRPTLRCTLDPLARPSIPPPLSPSP